MHVRNLELGQEALDRLEIREAISHGVQKKDAKRPHQGSLHGESPHSFKARQEGVLMNGIARWEVLV